MPQPVPPRMDTKSPRSVRFLPLFLLAALGGCSASTSTTTPTPKAASPVPSQAPGEQTLSAAFCDTAACWQQRADQARGIPDVAAAYLGRAFARQPSLSALTTWLDRLIASGQLRAAHAAAAMGEKLPAQDQASLEKRLATLPQLPSHTRLAPGTKLPEAWVALAGGDVKGATSRYQHAITTNPEPYHLARLAELEARRGAPDKARATRAAARIQADERGAAMRLEPADSWHTRGAVWAGKHLVLSRSFDTRDYGLKIPATRIEFWKPDHPEGPDFSYVLPGPAGALVLSDDGQHLVRASSPITINHVYSGQQIASIPVSDRLGPVVTVGRGEHARLLCAVGRNVELYNFGGQKLAQYALKGTTPTITRVYRTGRGTHHDNILKDSPTWPVALALTEDAAKVAVGGSDGKVRLFHGNRQRPKLLEYTWKYEERRHQGGNPDLNLPLDMRFIDGGKSLVVAYRHGDVITWDTANGKQRKHVPGNCSVEEATTVVNMYNTRDMPQKKPSTEEREKCGYANTGRFSHDARLLVAAGSGLRIRDRAGTARAMIVRGDGTLIPDDMLEFASDGTLALVNLYGRPEFWRGGNKLESMFSKKAQTGPITPEVTNHGQYLAFELGRETFIWDLQTGEKIATKLAAKETLAAISPDATQAVVRTAKGAGELRNLRDQVTTTSWPNLGNMVEARFSHAGTHVVVDRGYEAERRILLRNLETDTEVELATPIVGQMPLVSAHGEALVSVVPRSNTLQIWNPTTGALAQTVDAPDLRAAALAPDGSFVVWISAAQDPQVTVHYLALKGQATPLPLEVEGWPKRACLTVSPDSSEVFICTERALARWYPREGRHTKVPREFVAADRASYSAAGDLLFLGSYGRVDLHRNTPKLEEVGTVYPLLDGGWLAMSHAGAVDGSKHAHASLVTFVVGLDRWIDDGILAWDRFATPGLYPRMLAGEDVQPPVPALPPEAVRPHEN